MVRLASSFLLMAAVVAASAPAGAESAWAESAWAESGTTRIFERPVYGATMTMEQGVRVIRPLPPTRHVIVNPHGRTPVSLSYQHVKVSEERTVHQHEAPTADGGLPVSGTAWPVYGLGAYGLRHRGPHAPHARSPRDRGR